jgi:hypothetical protein
MRAALRDTTTIEATPDSPPPETSFWPWVAAAALLVVIIAVILLVRWRQRKRIRSPALRALYEWQRLMTMKLPERGRSERFITLLTLLLRDYLERDCQLRTRRQTTAEFLSSLPQLGVFTPEEKQFLGEFLHRADAVKYARVPMSIEECSHWAEQSRLFLQRRAHP